MNFDTFKTAVEAAAKRMGLSDYELYYASSESTTVSAFQHEINQFASYLEGGVCFRCLVDGKMGYASTEELSEEMAVSIVRRAADNASSLESEEKEFLGEGGKTYAAVQPKQYELPGADQLILTALKGQDALYAADKMVVDGCETEVGTTKSAIAIANSKGLDLKYESRAGFFVSAAVVSDGQEMSDSYEIKVGDLNGLNVAETAGKAVSDAKSKLNADVAPTGAYPVVFAPKAMASLISTYASVFSSEAARKGLSKLLDKEGETIAAPIVTLVDDPFYPESPMPIPFDAEGTPTERKNIIEKGRLNTLLYNLKSAAALGKQTTGNASKASYDSPVAVSPFTLYLDKGDLSEEELLQKAANGVYVDFLGGLHAGANVISGDFSLQAAGFMIEEGRKGRAVKSFTVAGNFYDLLKQITALSDRIEYRGMGGMTAFASPCVLVEGLSVAGK